MRSINKLENFGLFFLFILFSITAINCGGTLYPQQETTVNSTIPESNQPNPTPSSSTGQTIKTGIPGYNYSFSMYGTIGGSYTPTAQHCDPTDVTCFKITDIRTDNVLKVTISATSPGTIPNNGGKLTGSSSTGYTVGFTCAAFNVKVGSKTTVAYVSTVPATQSMGPCTGLGQTNTLDFSDQLGGGHGAMSVEISDAQYDNCRLYGMLGSGGCSMSYVYWTHRISGSAVIHVNGTD